MHADLPSEDMRRREIGDPLEPNPHRALPGYTDWIRQNGGELRCEVLSVQPELVLKWRYTKEQEETMQTWRCGTVGYGNRLSMATCRMAARMEDLARRVRDKNF